MRTSLLVWRSSLYAALGIATFACGGETSESRNDGTVGSGGAEGGTGGSGTSPGGTAGTGGAAGTGGSGGGGASGSSGGGGTGGTTLIDLSCRDPQPMLIGGKPTGLTRCSGGYVHRAERRDCPSLIPRPDPVDVPAVDGGVGVGCTRDQDCSHLLNGYCHVPGTTYPQPMAFCVSGCVRDEDCTAGSICSCSEPIGQCVSASCRTDSDCSPGLLCTSSPQESPCGGYYAGDFACQKPTDACRGYEDCSPEGTFSTTPNCVNGADGRRCSSSGACGRPFLIGGEARQASLAPGATGWTASTAPSLSALDGAERAALAEHWSRNGLMEHASVAAFARFTLELLALGAPADLVRGAQQALGDEIAHAELCFGLATAYAGQPLEPGPLPVEGALGALDFVDVVSTAIAEACVGETLAAVEAAEACAHAVDPEVRSVLERIAADEARHAELGWKFLRWALSRATGTQRERLRALTSRLVSAELASPDAAPSGELALRARGVLGARLRGEVRRAALTQLVAPLAQSLFDTPRAASEPRARC